MAKSFKWGDNYKTGLLEVDEQHKRLVDLINQLGDCLSQNDLNLDEIEYIFNELVSYTKHHFTDEQSMMIRVGIDHRHLDRHIQSHYDFINELTALHDRVSPDNDQSVDNLLDFLVNWLACHILDTDQNMARQVELIKQGSTAQEAYEEEERRSHNSTEPLLAALKDLLHQVTVRNKELVMLNETLEEKVIERTAELSKANKSLKQLALTDVLTGLPNRRHAMQQLSLLWKEMLEHGTTLSCMMIDADHFKEVNDQHGHDAGDNVLRELARILQHSVRTDDIVCRLGGDEFLIICPHTDTKGGLIVANFVHQAVAMLRISVGASEWVGSISVGIASYTPNMNTHDDLMKLADEGVYAAKMDGKNCVRSLN
ncbi:GGDEF domain-containing protein [Neptunomonas sp.]|uniref:GGDEF domain-containing protein n=1 Tax=Neptunomonas sp. TaxID=1971898 RepID=UPI0025D5597B|nr:GGDEF domain-containing protein [Neptunomonas sp.]